MERIRSRLKITERELKQALIQYKYNKLPDNIVNISEFSLANSHPQTSIQPGLSDTNIPKERMKLIQQALKARDTALENVSWPKKYDEIIKAYFSEE